METRNLCAKIPVPLHEMVREHQQASGLTLSEYMSTVLTHYFKEMEGKRVEKSTRTVAFQVTDEEFLRLKACLKRKKEKQKDFLYKLLLDFLEESEALVDEETLKNQLEAAKASGEKRPRNRKNIGDEYENSCENLES